MLLKQWSMAVFRSLARAAHFLTERKFTNRGSTRRRGLEQHRKCRVWDDRNTDDHVLSRHRLIAPLVQVFYSQRTPVEFKLKLLKIFGKP
jgi:hypothetical protein